MADDIIAIDFFCGAGGLTLGLRNAGIKVVKGIDNDSNVEKTYKNNNPGIMFLNKDVTELTEEEMMMGVNRSGKKLLFAGCAPCQPFSRQNRNSKNDLRKSLISNFSIMVEKVLPEYVLVENVPDFMKEDNKYHKIFLEVLEKNGYNYVESILNAADYGVPQKRKRYVLLASRIDEISLPEKTHGEGKERYRTVRDAIEKYPSIKAGENWNENDIPNHDSRKLSKINLKRIKMIPRNGGSRDLLPDNFTLPCHRNHEGHKDVYGRMFWDKPSPTLTCKCSSFSNGRFGHPSQNRAISLREAAALQTFPDNYIFYGSKTAIAKFVGNAVPVLFAEKIARCF